MAKNSTITKRDVECLLAEQTKVLLGAVDERLGVQETVLLAQTEKRFEHSEKRFGEKLDRLMTTLDRFLKRLTDFEDEFHLLKREKLGVTIG
jgi:hypothetical protein